MMPATSVSAAARSGVANSNQRAVSARASSLSRIGVRPGGEEPAHPLADALAPGLFRGHERREAPAADGADPVRDGQELVEILGDDEDGGARVAQRQKRAVDRGA